MKNKKFLLNGTLLAFAGMVIIIICLISLCESVATTENLDNLVKGTHKIVNHVDSVWESQNDSIVSVSKQ